MLDRLQLLERRDIDELIILDIQATKTKKAPRFSEIAELSANLFCPLTIGGGVRSTDDIRQLLASGADKVAVGSAAIDCPALITEAAQKFGSQSIVVSIDVKDTVWTNCGKRNTGLHPVQCAHEFESRGAGEILLTDIERDGTMQGYNLDLIRSVSTAVSIPVIACGGCGSAEHMRQAVEAGAHAVAAGAMFQFREVTPKEAARHLEANGISARL